MNSNTAIASKDRNFGLVGTFTFHALIILGLMFGFRSCELEGGGGGGNGGNGDGLMSLDIAGLGNDVDGWGATAAPAVAQEAPVEPVEQTPDVSDNSSDMVTTSPDQPTNTRPRNTTTQTQTQTPTQTQPQPSNALNNALNGLNSGSGNTSGNGQQGNPNGQVNGRGVINGGGGSPGSGGGTGGGNGTGNGPGNGSGSGIGVGFSLNGRSWRQMPSLNETFNDDGFVLVNITVDKNGNVLTAIADPKSPITTTNSARLHSLAEKAAKAAKFNVVETGMVQRGTITIEFKLR